MAEENQIGLLMSGAKPSGAKARIVSAALEEFGLNSLGAARTRKIAERAGVNHAAINYYFGGKEELYAEVARQIIDFIAIYDREHYERFEEVRKSRSAKDAKELIRHILESRMCCEDSASDILRNIIMIITREEFNNGQIFDLFFEKAFKPINEMMSQLITIASGGRYAGENAYIMAKMLLGQVHMFNNARTGVKRSMGWDKFDAEAADKVKAISAELLDKIFK